MHAISEKRLKLLLAKMKASETGTPKEDQRGRRPSVRKITGPTLDTVFEHIRSLPTTTSHYTRAKSPHKHYLPGSENATTLYEKYKAWMSEYHPEVEKKVTLHMYRDIFTHHFNIGFQPPRQDTCSTCDAMNAELQGLREREEDTTAKEEALNNHKEYAKTVQRLLSSQRDLPEAEEDELTVRVVAMDLQQTLPCPRLSTGVAYYLRKLWVYNFCIYDVTKGKASMFVWDEPTGGRGSDEVASCIMKWLELRQEQGEEIDVLRIFCDNCGGQNKNINIMLAALRLIHGRKLVRVELVFMLSGHSYMPCDRSFGVIERKLRVAEGIHTTDHYETLIREATNPPYETIRMQREEFYDVKALAKHVTKRSTAVSFSKACQLVVTFDYKEGYYIKTDYSFDDTASNVVKCRLMKGQGKYKAKSFNLADVPLLAKYPTERSLNPQKVKDLRTLTAFMGPTSKAWMLGLVQRQETLQREGAPALSDEEDDVHDYDDPSL